VREKYKGLGIIPVATTSQEMARLIREDLKKNAELVQRIGIKPE
jgi:tripartite-type tricarboxylate transporter receptor subunit TctC